MPRPFLKRDQGNSRFTKGGLAAARAAANAKRASAKPAEARSDDWLPSPSLAAAAAPVADSPFSVPRPPGKGAKWDLMDEGAPLPLSVACFAAPLPSPEVEVPNSTAPRSFGDNCKAVSNSLEEFEQLEASVRSSADACWAAAGLPQPLEPPPRSALDNFAGSGGELPGTAEADPEADDDDVPAPPASWAAVPTAFDDGDDDDNNDDDDDDNNDDDAGVLEIASPRRSRHSARADYVRSPTTSSSVYYTASPQSQPQSQRLASASASPGAGGRDARSPAQEGLAPDYEPEEGFEGYEGRCVTTT